MRRAILALMLLAWPLTVSAQTSPAHSPTAQLTQVRWHWHHGRKGHKAGKHPHPKRPHKHKTHPV